MCLVEALRIFQWQSACHPMKEIRNLYEGQAPLPRGSMVLRPERRLKVTQDLGDLQISLNGEP